MDRELIIDTLRSTLSREDDLVAAWLFGSVARGACRSGGDVDVAVLGAAPLAGLPGLRLDRVGALSASLGREVDLVDLTRAPSDLVHRVLRDGVLLLERDRARRVRFEVDARNRYFDMQPIWREYRRGATRGSPR